jgi:ABC-type polar amino acid transport system ATPase subunit
MGFPQCMQVFLHLLAELHLVLFDEPTSALDPQLIGEVLEVMKELAEENLTMLVVTHEMGFAQSVASEMFFMENGKIVESGPPTDLIHNPREKRTKEFLRNISKLYKDHG